MKIKEKIELIIMYVVSLCIITISILDFFDALDSLPWLAKRVPILTLLAIGLIALFLITQNSFEFHRNQRVRTVTYSEGYKELQKRIMSAKKEILILTEYINIFDWECGAPKWDPERRNSSHRKAFYHTLQSKLLDEKGNRNFRLVKIVQIPKGHEIKEMLQHDPIYAENCNFIAKISKKEPEFACLRITNMNIGNSILLIDESFAHISFDIRNPFDLNVDAPIVLLIDDPKSESIEYLSKLFQKIEANSLKVEFDDIVLPALLK